MEYINKYTVKELSELLSNTINKLNLKNIRLEGEVINKSELIGKHYYFSLKEGDFSINCVWFNAYNIPDASKLKDGDKIVLFGKVVLYKAKNSCQIQCSGYEPAGIGAVLKNFENLKFKLKAEGLFDEKYKKPLPKYVRTIGVITSKDSDACNDICKIAHARCKGINIIIADSFVQGENTESTVIKSLRYLESLPYIDVIIISRGGGSAEDLGWFNNENIAREIFNAKKPIVTGIGHQEDSTIADFVADQIASTPSNAAELVVFSSNEELSKLREINNYIFKNVSQKYKLYGQNVNNITLLSPIKTINQNLKTINIYKQDIYKLISLKLNNKHLLLGDTPKYKISLIKDRSSNLETLNKSILYILRLQINKYQLTIKDFEQSSILLNFKNSINKKLNIITSSMNIIDSFLTHNISLLQSNINNNNTVINLKRIQNELYLKQEKTSSLKTYIDYNSNRNITEYNNNLKVLFEHIKSLSPDESLNRGYAILLDEKNLVIKSASEISFEKPLKLYLKNENLLVKIQILEILNKN